MRTLGIDLAAEAANTATCVIDWNDGQATVRSVETPADDGQLVELSGDADKVGIDAPFGWPDEFVDAVKAHKSGRDWPGGNHTSGTDQAAFRRSLSFRTTDQHVLRAFDDDGAAPAGGWPRPLSVSADKIGVTAMRCAYLLEQMDGRAADRTGTGLLVEVYPAAALAKWGLPCRGYKRTTGLEQLGVLGEALLAQVHWLSVEPYRDSLLTNDHCFDALVSALVARAAALTPPETIGPTPEVHARASREGWIHLPKTGSLPNLP